MRSKFFLSIFFLFTIIFCEAQDSSVVFSSSMLDYNSQSLWLGDHDGWIFKEGNDTTWAKENIDLSGWKKFKPTQLTVKNADKNGRVEGWFRLSFRLDSSLANMPIGIVTGPWAASDIYVDGNYIGSSGNTGQNGRPFQETKWDLKAAYFAAFQPGTDHILALHLVEYRSPFNRSILKTEALINDFGGVIGLEGPGVHSKSLSFLKEFTIFWYVIVAVLAVLTLLFWLLFFQNPGEKVLFTISLTISLFTIATFCEATTNTKTNLSFVSWSSYGYAREILYGIVRAVSIFILLQIFRRRVSYLMMLAALIAGLFPFINNYFFQSAIGTFGAVYMLLVNSFIIASSWRSLKGSQWIVVTGMVVTFLWSMLALYNLVYGSPSLPSLFDYICLGGTFLTFPVSLLIYVASRFKEILTEVRKNADEVMKLSEEKKEQALKQQKILEDEVARQTRELRTAFENLKSTQAQLIQSEKMASLGELTAGIAHEIQNPLNFVNNFSDVNKELLSEMKDELIKGNMEDAKTIANDVIENEEKISHHGRRAEAIVKGMLQHSRASSGQKEPTDIKALADEYLRLAYHGLKAKDKLFDAVTKTEFDNKVGSVNLIPQDIGRVILNLANNAFYSVNEKRKENVNGYQPTVTITTSKKNGKIELIIKDNGNGIPEKYLSKIFQPFFTTKPTGQGTGLGLSLAYDIIKAHGGEIKLNTKEKDGTEFIIVLPV